MLISEPPIHVSPSLARVFGFNEAAVIQEIHFWLNPNVTPHFSLYHKDGRYWIPDVFDQLFQKFSFWDEDTIAYMCAAFEQSGILMMLEVEDPSQSFGKIIYHTLNYDVLREMSSAKPMPTSPFIGSILGEPVLDMGSNFDPAANENINIQSSFLVRIHKSAPDVYVMEVQDSPPFLMSELLLELEARPEKVEYQLPIEDLSHKGAQHKEEANETMPGGLPSKDLICHFPKIGDVELKAFVWGDTTLYKIVMVTFQMNILEEIFSFCETHKASRMVIFADNVDELGIYKDFLAYKDKSNPCDLAEGKREEEKGEQTVIVIPVDQKTLDLWAGFMKSVKIRFYRVLWNGQKDNPAIQHYLKFRPLSES